MGGEELILTRTGERTPDREDLQDLGHYYNMANISDGSCMFQALSEQLKEMKKIEISRFALRELVCNYLEQNKDFFKNSITLGADKADLYINNMRKDNTHGDHIELQAVSFIYDVGISIHQAGSDDPKDISDVYVPGLPNERQIFQDSLIAINLSGCTTYKDAVAKQKERLKEIKIDSSKEKKLKEIQAENNSPG